MECDICLVEWDSTHRIPRLLNCGHTFCHMCLRSILSKSLSQKKPFQCPTCNVEQPIKSEKDIKSLIKNFNLLRIVEKIEERRTSGINPNATNTNAPSVQENESSDNQLQLSNIKFDINKKCSKHKYPLHSYAIGSSMLFCDKCLENSKVSTNPLPNVYNDIRSKIDSSLFKACSYKNIIKHLKTFLTSYLIEFEKESILKIEKVFQYLYGIIKYFHNDTKQLLNQCITKQKVQINEHINKMESLSNELSSIENHLVNIASLPNDKTILSKIETIRKTYHKLTNYLNFDMNFDLFTMNIGLNENEEKNLFNAIRNSFKCDVDFLEINGKPPSITQIFNMENNWYCICEEINNPNNEIKCNSCGLMRRIETMFSDEDENDYENENTNKVNELIQKRREEELNIYEYLMKGNNDKSVICLIDKEWFSLWKSFIKNNAFCENEDIIKYAAKSCGGGILPPGPITNFNLIDKDNNEKIFVKKGLKNKIDYVMINKKVWDFFFLNYNGGPYIELSKVDEIDVSESVKHINDVFYMNYSTIKEEFSTEDDNNKNLKEEIIDDDSEGEIIINDQ